MYKNILESNTLEVDRQSIKLARQKFLIENATESELRFQQLLRQAGILFEFQAIICGYYPDFYFPQHYHRIIEIDGSSHKDRHDSDRHRDEVLRRAGHKTLRIRADRVFWDEVRVMAEVRDFLCGATKKQKKASRKRNRKARRWARRMATLPDPLTDQFLFLTDGL